MEAVNYDVLRQGSGFVANCRAHSLERQWQRALSQQISQLALDFSGIEADQGVTYHWGQLLALYKLVVDRLLALLSGEL